MRVRRVDVDAEGLQVFAGAAAHGAPVDQAQAVSGWAPMKTFSATLTVGTVASS